MSQINVDIIEPFTGGSDLVTVNGIICSTPSSGTIQLTSGFAVANAATVSTLVGDRAGEGNTNTANTFIGYRAGRYATNGLGVFVGNSSGVNCTGLANTFVGNLAGQSVTGDLNVYIGNSAGNNAGSGSNNVAIGNQSLPATTSTSNSITLGNVSHNVLRCAVTSITSLSDARDKKDVADLSVGLEFVKGLRPVEFVWDDRDENGKHEISDFGFIAQDLKAAQEDAEMADVLKLVYDENPEKLEASYGKLLPILVKAIQELAAEVETLKNK
jgi:hypothetical protein